MSKHRVEALTDGIYAIAMTLLVLELKLPEHASDDMVLALVRLLPKLSAWFVSFFILAIFWIGHQRIFHYVAKVDEKLTWITLFGLLFASAIPFASALVGEHADAFASQVVYAANMAGMGLVALWQLRYLDSQDALRGGVAIPRGQLRASQFRCRGIVAVAGLAVVIAWFAPRFATMAFTGMFVIGRISRRLSG